MRLEIIPRNRSNKTQKLRSLVIAMLAGLLVIFWVHEPGGMVGAVEAKSLEPDECSANIPYSYQTLYWSGSFYPYVFL